MFERIKEIIADYFDVDPEEISPETSLRDDLGADSLDLLEMVMKLEDEYNIEIDVEEEMDNIQTVEDVADFLKSRGID